MLLFISIKLKIIVVLRRAGASEKPLKAEGVAMKWRKVDIPEEQQLLYRVYSYKQKNDLIFWIKYCVLIWGAKISFNFCPPHLSSQHRHHTHWTVWQAGV